MKRFLSLGAGVQSSTLLLMSDCGELPKLDAAVFADTGWESKATYEHLGWLAETVNIPIYVVQDKNIRVDIEAAEVRNPNNEMHIPAFTQTGALPRQCSSKYKIIPIRRKIRELNNGAHPLVMWIGFSVDEVGRIGSGKYDPKYITKIYPLIDLRMTRYDCLEWNKSHGFPVPPRSSCIGCPYKSRADWRSTQDSQDEFADAVLVDRLIRQKGGGRGDLYLHQSCEPLDKIDFRTLEDLGQMNWLNECDGGCNT